jgi:hypothetical protein
MSTFASGKMTFGLPAIFATLTTAAVVCAVLAQVPSDRLLTALRTAPALLGGTALLALLPLLVIHLTCIAAKRCLPGRLRNRSTAPLRLFAPHRLLVQASVPEPPAIVPAAIIALAVTFILPLMWAFLRELGLACAVALSQGFSSSASIFAQLPLYLTPEALLGRLFRWELFALWRWWILFGLIAALWIVVAWPLRRRRPLEPAWTTVRRLLAFAPWIAVLEIAFLVGVWTLRANVVPEPSTGFVEGIFSWDRWHWHGWLGVTWINRGLLPTLLVASLFFRYVLRWRWLPAIAVATCLVPLALTLSIAWTVLYQHPEPLLEALGRS